ncbi:MAG: hypothetical protein AB7G62_14920 [Magnetospirillum sp.]
MRRFVFSLIMVFAALAAGAWPAVADWTPRAPMAHMQAPAQMHHVGHGHEGHLATVANHDQSPDHGNDSMTPRHCGSMVMACGTGIVGTLPMVLSMPGRLPVALVLWAAPDHSLVALSVLPGYRPPRSFT